MNQKKKNILIVDDEADIRKLVQGILSDEGYDTQLAANSKAAYEILQTSPPDLIVLDIWLQESEHDGLKILETIGKKYAGIPVIMISGHGTIETAVAAIKQGAYDFIEKPFKADRLLLMVQRGLEAAELKRENIALKKQGGASLDLIGKSAFIKNLREVIKRAAPNNSRVLLTGEAGTGKGVVARLLHAQSGRAGKPFLSVNCGVLEAQRLDAELFGSEGDAGQGGDAQVGALESANGGTVFLDEVGDIPLETQGRLVRFLQDNHFKRTGGSRVIEADVRVIASSNKNLEDLMEKGDFREDLFYRLNVVPIQMIALRERIEDIELLSRYFLEALCEKTGRKVPSFTEDALSALRGYGWPGNIRQLHNVLEWMMIMHSDFVESHFDAEHLPPEFGKNKDAGSVHHLHMNTAAMDQGTLELSLRDAREVFERNYLFAQVDRFGGNISKTAKFIGMERSALHRKLKSLQQSDDDLEEDPSEDIKQQVRG